MHIEKRGNSLLIRFTHDSKHYSFSLPKHNNSIGISAAKLKMAEIEKDIQCERFDPTLLKYKPRKTGKNRTEITAVELFTKYITDRERDGFISTRERQRLETIAAKLGRLIGDKPTDKVTEAIAKDAIARWSETASNRTIKTYLYHFRSCWDWARGKYHVHEVNPWSECLDRAKQRVNNTQPKQKKPFTIPELQAVIAAFDAHTQYQHYTEFVIFLSHTACRPGEAAGLRWKHLGADFSTAWIGESISRGHQNSKGTKTGKSRTIQLSPTVRSMLGERFERLNPQPGELVFPSPKGVAIDDHNFCNRAWKTILTSCHIDYRSPYQLRHSAISHALSRGANPIALAEQTGHDKRVLLSTYAHAIDRECLFVDIGAK